MPRKNRYDEGYQAQEYIKANGKLGTRLVYTGEWYTIPSVEGAMGAYKLRLLLITLLGYAAFFHAQFCPSPGGLLAPLAIPSLFALVPMLWQLVAFFHLLPAKERWELRLFHAGYRRLFRNGVVLLILLLLWLLMELAYILLLASTPLEELRYLLEALLSVLAIALQLWQIRRHPARVVEKE